VKEGGSRNQASQGPSLEVEKRSCSVCSRKPDSFWAAASELRDANTLRVGALSRFQPPLAACACLFTNELISSVIAILLVNRSQTMPAGAKS
jgi:hypothetical protein